MKEITSKQFGDACEMHVIAELMFAGRPAVKMPDGWRGYDIIAETDDGPTRISVKGMRFDSRRSNRSQAGWWAFTPDSEWDWLALVYLNVDDSTRQIYLVPRRWALANSFDRPHGQRGIYRRNNAQLSRFANNLALSDDPPERAEASEPDAPPA
jgi:hypothetical protein